jgi:hypothetical protein
LGRKGSISLERFKKYNEMKQTAVDYIRQHFIMDEEFEKLFEEAKQMEKEQIQDAYWDGIFNGEFLDGEGYYKETYE